jgi:hypothetical protein
MLPFNNLQPPRLRLGEKAADGRLEQPIELFSSVRAALAYGLLFRSGLS